jgi:hypothetical protein
MEVDLEERFVFLSKINLKRHCVITHLEEKSAAKYANSERNITKLLNVMEKREKLL